MRALILPWLLLVSSCMSGPGGVSGRLPERIVDLPWTEAPADQTVLQARGCFVRGDMARALELVDLVLADRPRHVDANRVRQDILRERGRRGLLMREVEGMLARDPEDVLAWYLRGRIASADAEKVRCFANAVRLAPDRLWGWLGLAHSLRSVRPGQAMRIFERLYELTDAHPVVALAYSSMLMGEDGHDRLVKVCETLRADARVPGVGALRLAQGSVAGENREAAWRALLRAVSLRPFDAAAKGLAAAWVRGGASGDQLAELFDVLRGEPERLRTFGRGAGVAPVVALLERERQPAAALALLEREAIDARRPDLRRAQRRLLLAQGDVAGFLALVREDVPRAIVGAEPNRLRGRWLRFLDGPWSGGEPLATEERAASLFAAMLDVGFLVEVEQCAAVALRRFPDSTAVRQARDEARAELAFEAGIRRLLYRGYREEDHADLETVTGRLRELSTRVLGKDVVGRPRRFLLPLVGELLDPFDGALAEHLGRYNRHLVLGRRAGGVAEGMLTTRLSLTELPDEPRLALPARCHEVIVVDRDVRALSGVAGGDFAGIALLDQFTIDFDAVREWAGSIADRRRILAEDGGAALRDPLPPAPGADPLDAEFRLAALSSVQDADLESAVLDMVRHHERQHLVDSFRYFPIEWNLGRGLGLMFRFGLSALAIQGEMERRAELASLAISPHTELVLAHIVAFLGRSGAPSPHHRGFGSLAEQIEAALRRRGAGDRAAPARWHELDMGLVREVAAELHAELGS